MTTRTSSPCWYDGSCLELRENHCSACGATDPSSSPSHSTFSTAPYGGDSASISATPASVPSSSVSSLVRCSRCCLVRYCNIDCQKRDYLAHKDVCRAVQQAKNELEELAVPLRNFVSEDGMAPTNLFETRVGDFWAIEETKDYICQRIGVVSAVETIAVEVETLEAWTEVVALHQETLRLNAKDNFSLRFCFPIALLRVNRDDDAFSFCRHWLSRDDRDPEDDQRRHLSSTEGDWVYPSEPNCRYLDIFQECQDVEGRAELTLLFSLAIIKMRLVAVHESRLKALEEATARAGPDDNLEALRRQIMGPVDTEQRLSDQSRQLDMILDLMDRRNNVMVQVLLNPGPLLSQRRPDKVDPGELSEARAVIEYVSNVWTSIPGASDYLERRLGTRTPTYLPNVSNDLYRVS